VEGQLSHVTLDGLLCPASMDLGACVSGGLKWPSPAEGTGSVVGGKGAERGLDDSRDSGCWHLAGGREATLELILSWGIPRGVSSESPT
jgi:hypothetical protein